MSVDSDPSSKVIGLMHLVLVLLDEADEANAATLLQHAISVIEGDRRPEGGIKSH